MRERILLASLLCVLAASLAAIPPAAMVEKVPVDRVITNLERMIAEDPTNIESRTNLARLHAMAYASKITEIPVHRTGPPSPPGLDKGQPSFGYKAPYLQESVKESGEKAGAIAALRRAVHSAGSVTASKSTGESSGHSPRRRRFT